MKTPMKFFLFLLILFVSCTAALAADNGVLSLDASSTNALLLKAQGTHYIVGGSNADAIIAAVDAEQISFINGIIAPCEHEEHISALQALSEHYQAVLYTRQETSASLPNGMQWLDSGVSYTNDTALFTFGAEEAGGIAYGCNAEFLSFSAATNQVSVNVRKQPNASANRIAKLTRGTVITVKEAVINENNEVWYQVVLSDGAEGYIRSDLLQHSTEAEVQQIAQASNDKKTETRYVGHKKNKVFHRPSCSSLPSGKNQVYFDSRSYAISKGYKPCSHCDP